MNNELDPLLREVLDKTCLKFDKGVCDNLARIYVKELPSYLDKVFRSANDTLGPDHGLVYIDYRILTPKEDFLNDINVSSRKNIIDTSTSYLYKVVFNLEYNNVPFKRVLSLPYTTQGGYLQFSDSHNCLNPVLSEYPISPAPGELFIRLLRDKTIIKRMERFVLKDNVKVALPIIFSKTYKLIEKVNDTIPVVLYVLIKNGFYNMFKDKFNTKPIIVDTTKTMLLNKYLKTGLYVEYGTTGHRPRNMVSEINYIKHSLSILVLKKDITPLLESYISSIMYSFDLTPKYALNIMVSIMENKVPATDLTFSNIDDESLYWVTMLGKIVFKNKFTEDRVHTDMLEHVNILNGYLDNIMCEKLLEIGIDIPDFFDLLGWCQDNFDNLVMQHDTYSSKTENRYLDLSYYLLYDIIVGINKSFLMIKRDGLKKELTLSEIERAFNKRLPSKLIFALIKGNLNLAVSPIDNTTDNNFVKTSVCEDQNRGSGVNRSKKSTSPANTKTLNVQDICFGSIYNVSKQNQSPRFKFNPYVKVNIATGKFIYTDNQLRAFTKLTNLLSNTFEDTKLVELSALETTDVDFD